MVVVFGGLGKNERVCGCTIGPMRSSVRPRRERPTDIRRSHRRHFNDSAEPNRSTPTAITAPFGELSPEAPGALALRRLANLVARYAPHDGAFPLRLPGTYAVRLSHMTTEPLYSTMRPAVCIVAQGAKVVMVGREVLEYDPAHVLVFALDLPVSSQVTRASRKEPYLAFILDLDPARIAELAGRVYPRGVPKASDGLGLYIGESADGIVDAVTRLLDLMARPDDAEMLGPLVVDEIVIRLLRTAIGPKVAQIGHPKSGLQRIADAVGWIRAHFA